MPLQVTAHDKTVHNAFWDGKTSYLSTMQIAEIRFETDGTCAWVAADQIRSRQVGDEEADVGTAAQAEAGAQGRSSNSSSTESSDMSNRQTSDSAQTGAEVQSDFNVAADTENTARSPSSSRWLWLWSSVLILLLQMAAGGPYQDARAHPEWKPQFEELSDLIDFEKAEV